LVIQVLLQVILQEVAVEMESYGVLIIIIMEVGEAGVVVVVVQVMGREVQVVLVEEVKVVTDLLLPATQESLPQELQEL
jgi:hypothetical protein